MTVTYGFYDSLNGDRVYNAGQMSKIFQGIISDGVMTSVGNGLSVTNNAGSMNINVASGRAWFKNTWTYNDATIVLTPDAAEPVLNRIDSVIVEVNTDINSRVNTIKILKGTPASSPVAPTLTNTATLGQYPLADIYIGAGVTAITQVNITNRIGTTDCPLASALVPAFDFSLLEQQYIAQFNAWFSDLQNELDSNQASNLQNQINLLESGWVPISQAATYSSADSPTFVVSFAGNMTSVLSPGFRIKLTQTTTKYFIVTAIGSYSGGVTLVTLYGGTDYTLTNAAISDPHYSTMKVPFGFPSNPEKWTVSVTVSTDFVQNNPTADVWYNATQIVAPIGLWNLYLACIAGAYDTSSTATNIRLSISSANNTSDQNILAQVTTSGALGNLYALSSIDLVRFLNITVKTTKYVNIATAIASVEFLALYNQTSPLVLRLVSAYL